MRFPAARSSVTAGHGARTHRSRAWRVLFVTALCVLLASVQISALAGDDADPVGGVAAPVVEPTVVPEAAPEPEPEPTPRPEPTATPEPTARPEPTTTPLPTATPEPTADPELAPEADPTAEPSSRPDPDRTPETEPTAEPAVTDHPTLEPTPSLGIAAGPAPSTTPEPEPEWEPAPSAAPSADPSVEPVAASPTPAAVGPSLRTDLLDYAPGSLVLLMGDGWAADEAIELFVNDDLGRTWQLRDTVVADADGRFNHEFRLPDRFVATYTVVATGAVSGETTWRFDDSIGTGPRTTNANGSPATPEVTIATPSTVPGRLLLATIVVDGLSNSQVICTPSGWTSIGRTSVNNRIAVQSFSRVATGAEAASYTWRFRTSNAACGGSMGGVNAGAVGGITAYAGVNTSSPIADWAGATRNGTYVDAPSVSGAPANATVVRAFGNASNTPVTVASASSTGVASSVAWALVRQASTLDPAAASADADHAAAGATGTLRASNGTTGDRWAAQTIVLRMVDSEPVVALTIGDATAQLGSTLTPDGDPSDAPDSVTALVDGSVSSAGACYRWGGSVTVSSNAAYHLTVRAAAANARLDFLAASPAAYAACAGGEPTGPAMFTGVTPEGAWITAQAASASRRHDYWLGLDVRWSDDPSPDLGVATLTIEASVDW